MGKVREGMGGDSIEVESGGVIIVKAGGRINVQDNTALADMLNVQTVDPEDGVTIWLDSGVLKIASAPSP